MRRRPIFRGMPARFLADAPAKVRKGVLDVFRAVEPTECEYDVLFRPDADDAEDLQIVGLDFDGEGARGCHFFLEPHEARAYRERNRRCRVAWADLPAQTQRAIIRYLEES